jgi:hypothetical protein
MSRKHLSEGEATRIGRAVHEARANGVAWKRIEREHGYSRQWLKRLAARYLATARARAKMESLQNRAGARGPATQRLMAA